jgi:hypothetical protein
MGRRRDLTGMQFRRLTVLGPAGVHITPKGKRLLLWRVRCSCADHTEQVVLGMALKQGAKVSCGCLRAERLALREEQWDDVPSRTQRKVMGGNPMGGDMSKPCVRCGSTERYTDGRCAACQRQRSRDPANLARNLQRIRALRADPAWRERNLQRTDPCARCGGTEWYASGNCVACTKWRWARRVAPSDAGGDIEHVTSNAPTRSIP